MTPTPLARERFGAAVRAERKSRSLSIESAAKAGGIGHMTWRKIEHGGSVHDQSYFAVDRAFGWESGYTIATVNADDEAASLPPPSGPGYALDPETKLRFATREETLAAMPREKEEENPSSDAFYTILGNIDMLALPELKAINAVLGVRLRERTEVLDSVKKKINRTDWSFPRFQVDYVATTPPDISDEYQNAYRQYMDAWVNIQDVASLVHECETKRAVDLHEVQQLAERADHAQKIIAAAIQRFNDAEDNAARNQDYAKQETE